MNFSISNDGSSCEIDIFDITEIMVVGGPDYGRYAKCAKRLICNFLSLDIFFNGEYLQGKLKVFYDTFVWRGFIDGLIYTDVLFLKSVRNYFVRIGITEKHINGIEYSEKGMQGDNYVSFDLNHDFVVSFVDFLLEKNFIDFESALSIHMLECII